MEGEKFVSVTHFINPHLFWYMDAVPKDYLVDGNLDNILRKLFAVPPNKTYQPKLNEIVAVRFLSWRRYIRARVLEIVHLAHADEYVVWAIDHGFPFQTKLLDMRRLLPEYGRHYDNVRCGGLAYVLPAMIDCDFVKMRTILSGKLNWLKRACELLEGLLNEAASISFKESFRSPDGQYWGELKIVNHQGKVTRATDLLIRTELAKVSGVRFKEICLGLSATKIKPWLSNSNNYIVRMNKYNYHYNERNMTTLEREECEESVIQRVVDWDDQNRRLLKDATSSSSSVCNCGMCKDDICLGDNSDNHEYPTSDVYTKFVAQSPANNNCLQQRGAQHKTYGKADRPQGATGAYKADDLRRSPKSMPQFQKSCTPAHDKSFGTNNRCQQRNEQPRTFNYTVKNRAETGANHGKSFPKHFKRPNHNKKNNTRMDNTPPPYNDFRRQYHGPSKNYQRNDQIKDQRNNAKKTTNRKVFRRFSKPTERPQNFQLYSQNHEGYNNKTSNLRSFGATQSRSRAGRENNVDPYASMLPAGFDLMNLNDYKDEKNHWHRKKTTRYDTVPHNYNSY